VSTFFGSWRPARQALRLECDPPSQELARKRVQASRQRKACRRPNATSAPCIFGCGAHTRVGSGADTAAERLVCIAIPFTGHWMNTVTVAAPGGTPLRAVVRPGSGAPPVPRDSFRVEVGAPATQTFFGTEATRAAGHVTALGLWWEPTAGLAEGVGLKHIERPSLETGVRSTDAGCRDGRGTVARPPQRLYRRGRAPFGVSGADGRFEEAWTWWQHRERAGSPEGSTPRGSLRSARPRSTRVNGGSHLGGCLSEDAVKSSRTGKPRRATGGSFRQRGGGTTDSPADQSLEVRRLHDANGKGARNHGDVGAAAGGGERSEGSDTEGTKRKRRRHGTPRSGNPVNLKVGREMQQALDAVGGENRRGGEKPRGRNMFGVWQRRADAGFGLREDATTVCTTEGRTR
jgi:hypothetical protein